MNKKGVAIQCTMQSELATMPILSVLSAVLSMLSGFYCNRVAKVGIKSFKCNSIALILSYGSFKKDEFS